MARHGENIRKRTDGRWEGRYKTFDENRGSYIYRSVYGSAYEEAKEKLSKAKLSLVTTAAGERQTRTETGNSTTVLFSQADQEWLAEIADKRK